MIPGFLVRYTTVVYNVIDILAYAPLDENRTTVVGEMWGQSLIIPGNVTIIITVIITMSSLS